MADRGSVARPYAQAVFEIASADRTLDAWSRFLGLAAVMAEDAAASRAISTPGTDLGRLARAFADLCREQLGNPPLLGDGERPAGVNFLRLLAENRRLDALPAIAERFAALKAEAENALDVTLTTAQALGETERNAIVSSLNKRFGRQIRLAVKQDEGLIGGARLQVGDRVIDGSIRTGLDKLATALRA